MILVFRRNFHNKSRVQASGKISLFCFQPVGWSQSVGSAGALCTLRAKSFLLRILPVPSLVFRSKPSPTICEVPAGWEMGALPHSTLLCGYQCVNRSLKRQTSFCPVCLTQLVSLKHPSAFHLIHVTVVDPSPLVPNLALLVMSISITSKALVFFPASRINGLAFIPLFKVSVYNSLCSLLQNC